MAAIDTPAKRMVARPINNDDLVLLSKLFMLITPCKSE
jgi:hypothetical protein